MKTPIPQLPARLGWSKGVIGPDWPGCINSGGAPAVYKSKIMAKHTGKPFMVAGQYLIEFCRTNTVLAMMSGRVTEDMARWQFRAYKTWSAAKRGFLRRCAAVQAEYSRRAELQAVAAEGMRAGLAGDNQAYNRGLVAALAVADMS